MANADPNLYELIDLDRHIEEYCDAAIGDAKECEVYLTKVIHEIATRFSSELADKLVQEIKAAGFQTEYVTDLKLLEPPTGTRQ